MGNSATRESCLEFKLCNMSFVFFGFGPELRRFDKQTFYAWAYSGNPQKLTDFMVMYMAGGPL